MDGGSITVMFKAITREYDQAVDRAKAKAVSFKRETDTMGSKGGVSMLGLATKATLVGTALVIAAQQANKFAKFMDGLDANAKKSGASLTGVAQATESFSNSITDYLSKDLDRFGKLLGYDRAHIRYLNEMSALQDAMARTAEDRASFFGTLPGVGGPSGLAPFLQAVPSFGTPLYSKEFTGALNKSIEQQIAKARTTPGKTDNMTSLRAGIAYLNKIEKDPRIKGDARTNLYVQLAQLQDELASLAQEQVTQKKKQKTAAKKEVAALQFSQVNLSLAGSLGAGPFLSSPVFQYAQQFGFKARPQDYLKDLRLQVKQAAGFDRNLTRLGKFGASSNLVGELAGMGQQGQDIAAALAKSPGLVKQYSRLADKRAAIAEKLQVQSMRVVAASVVVQGNRVVGVDRNGNGQLEKAERFTVLNGGTVRRGGDRMGGV